MFATLRALFIRIRNTLDWYPARGETAKLGRRGEDAAAKFLRSLGYRVLARNVRVPMGEADMICETDDKVIVIVEVKARTRGLNERSDAFLPEHAVTVRKRRTLRRIANYLAPRNGWSNRVVRVDAVAVEFPVDGAEPIIRHLPGIA